MFAVSACLCYLLCQLRAYHWTAYALLALCHRLSNHAYGSRPPPPTRPSPASSTTQGVVQHVTINDLPSESYCRVEGGWGVGALGRKRLQAIVGI